MEMLDNALTIFIEKAPPNISRAVNSAKKGKTYRNWCFGFSFFSSTKKDTI